MDKGKQERVFKNFLIYNPTTSSPDPIFDELESTLKERNIAVIFIDYIQLMKYPKMQDFDSLRVLTRELKLFALRNNVCLITASQTRREAEVLGSSLSTLFGSSTIENDANIIMFLERERAGSERVRMSNIVPINIMISKNRSGEQGVVNTEVDYSNGHIIDRTC
jgi:replicative DNA helicase